jgi:histone-lysine N-methyltransferase SETMAR
MNSGTLSSPSPRIRPSDQIPDKTHIRHIMLYEFRKGSSGAEACRNICAIYPGAIGVSQCKVWFQKFRSGDFSLKDEPRSGRPRELDNDVLKNVIEADPRQTAGELAEIFGTSATTVLRHLHEIGKVSRAGVWVPHELSDQNKAQRSAVCASLLSRQEQEPFLRRIVTGDEKWVLYTNVKRRNQWLTPGQKPVPTTKPGLHPNKVLLCVWWDCRTGSNCNR